MRSLLNAFRPLRIGAISILDPSDLAVCKCRRRSAKYEVNSEVFTLIFPLHFERETRSGKSYKLMRSNRLVVRIVRQ
jgi:hypothetical protein